MAVRKCPQCLALVPAGHAVAYSNAIECPGCKRRLVVSDGSRYIATLAGLLAAVLVWRMAGPAPGMFGWVLPVVQCFLAFSIVAPLALILVADLRLAPEEPAAPSPSHTHPGHGHH